MINSNYSSFFFAVRMEDYDGADLNYFRLGMIYYYYFTDQEGVSQLINKKDLSLQLYDENYFNKDVLKAKALDKYYCGNVTDLYVGGSFQKKQYTGVLYYYVKSCTKEHELE